VRRGLWTAIVWLALVSADARALTIVGVNLGFGVPPEASAGGGSLDAVFASAAGLWERAIHDEHTVTIQYSWGRLADFLGYAIPFEEDGRAVGGTLFLTNAPDVTWFLDATPDGDEEFGPRADTSADYGGGGAMNVGRVHEAVAADAVAGYDLFSVLLHEIGHTLGVVDGFTGFLDETADGDVDVAAPLPFAGASIPLSDPDHLESPASMYGFFGRGERRLLSAADVLAMAQVNGFAAVDLDPARVPEPATLALVALGLAGLLVHRPAAVR
jgi:hypothetical protein